MVKRGYLYLLPVVFVVAAALLLPAALRAVPPRYLARMPEPLQQLGAPRDQSPILPTVAVAADAGNLLRRAASPTLAATPDLPAPAIVTESSPAPAATGTATTLPPTFTPPPPPTDTPIPIPAAVRLEGFEHQFQLWNNCGPTTLAMTLSYFDLHLTQSDTAGVLKPNPEDRNVGPQEMAAYVNNQTPFAALARANGTRDTVRRLVAEGIPVILEIGIEPPGEFRWMGWYGHYLLVVAYDDAAGQFWVYDSWLGTSEVPLENADKDGRVLTYDDFERDWAHFNRTYIAVYRPEQAETVAAIIGEEMDDTVMWQKGLARAQADAAAQPDNAFYWFNLGTGYNALGQYEEAATAFDQARAIGLPWRMLWYQFGPYEAYYQTGRYEDVVLLADVTLKDRPYFEESFYYKGIALAAQGDTNAARDNLEKAIAFNPNFAPAAVALEELEIGD